MHRPAFRSVVEHTTRSVIPSRNAIAQHKQIAPLSITTTAFFSSTPSQAVLKWLPGSKARQAAAASELSSLENGNSATSTNTNTNNSTSKLAVADTPAKERKPNPHFSAAAGPDSRIINVRSLPRTLSDGSGPSRFPGPSGVSNSYTGGRFRASVQQPGQFQRGGGRGRGARRGTGRGRGSGRRGRGDRGGRAEGGRSKADEDWSQTVEDMYFNEAREWEHNAEYGLPTPFEPALSLDGLVGYSPAIASAEAPSGSIATALRSMRVMAGGRAFTGSLEKGASLSIAMPNPEEPRDLLHEGKTVFFDTLTERARVEKLLHSQRATKMLKDNNMPLDTTLIGPVSEATKTAIVEAAVRGLYDGPPEKQTGSLLDTTHQYQAKEATYSGQHGLDFDNKVRELLPKESTPKSSRTTA